MTSGTSGMGQEIHTQVEAELEKTASLYGYHFTWAGLKPGDTFFFMLPMSMLAGGIVEYTGAVAFGLSVASVATYSTDEKLRLMKTFQPAGFMALTGYLMRLVVAAENGDIDIRRDLSNLRAVFTGGEPYSLKWAMRMQEIWGAPISDRYGTSQTRSDCMFTCENGIGSEARPGLLHCIEHGVLFEIVNPDSGEPVKEGDEGEVVLTSLTHVNVPLLRFATSDRARYLPNAYCDCGRPFDGIQVGSVGRYDDMMKIKGVNVWPNAVDSVISECDFVADYQIRLLYDDGGYERATVEIEPVPGRQYESEAYDALEKKLHQRIGVRFDVARAQTPLERTNWKTRHWFDARKK